MLSSKYIDLALIVFMGYFAFTNFSNGRNGLGILFLVLALMNILSFVMKTKQGKESAKSK